ncbi:MAG: transporter [Sphingomonas sp.]|nr:transporter [Sphingomonas sp.]
MKFLFAWAAALACLMSSPAAADSADVEQLRAAMKAARWTGPLLASNAETLPHGHFYTEPYFFDGISGGDHHPGTSGFYQYGVTDNWTVGMQPFFGLGTQRYNREVAVGDFKLLSQVRLNHFTPERQVPSIALVTNLVVPTGKYDHLDAQKSGHGSGAWAPEIGVNVQQYFLLKNGRLLRGRINILKDFPLRTDVTGRSVYGTDAGFRGHARPGSKTTVILGAEYSLTREWVLAFDVEADHWGKTHVTGHDATGALVDQTSANSWNVGFAPGVEYNWSDRAGAIFGVWIVPKGHNTRSSVTPAIAIQRFW